MLDREKDLERFKDLFLANFSQDQLGNLLIEFIKENNRSGCIELEKSKPIRELFNLRLKYLE